MLVKLSDEDMHNAKVMGEDTVKICMMQGLDPRLENPKQTREEANICGYKAEFAVCRLFNLPEPRFNITSDGGVDLWWDFLSIDVKWSRVERGALVFDNLDKFRAQVAIAVGSTSDPSVMRINGWVNKPVFERDAKPKDYGYGERLKMDAKALIPIERLWRSMTEAILGPETKGEI